MIEGIIQNELGLTAWSLTVGPMINPLQAGNANFHSMELETLKDLYIHQLKDLHSAERQLNGKDRYQRSRCEMRSKA